MGVPYYPHAEEPVSDRPGFVFVDGTYALDWHAWGDAHWQELDRVYRGLPGWVGYHQVPCWFGADESVPPWLSASVEPSGLQVAGRLRVADWGAWHEAFLARVQKFPGRDEGA